MIGSGDAGTSLAAALSPPLDAAAFAGPDIGSPRAACLAATRQAEETYDLPRGLLVAVALAESGLHAYAMNIRGRAHFPEDGATARALLRAGQARGAVMAGCVQINTAAHARTADWPLDPVRSADWAGRHLRDWYDQSGDWVQALRRWHGGSRAGDNRAICRIRAKLEVTAPGVDLLNHFSCSEGGMARIRRSGEALLEMAEAP